VRLNWHGELSPGFRIAAQYFNLKIVVARAMSLREDVLDIK
jgi:hypothetical protein